MTTWGSGLWTESQFENLRPAEIFVQFYGLGSMCACFPGSNQEEEIKQKYIREQERKGKEEEEQEG